MIFRVRDVRCDDRDAVRRWSSAAAFVVGGDSPLESINLTENNLYHMFNQATVLHNARSNNVQPGNCVT